ncbi:hypothetical protein CR513_47429, partial [Mucuna pruriens]
MNHDRVGRRYDLKFATYGLESLRKSIVGIHHKRKLSESFLSKRNRATWVPSNVRTILDEHWTSIDFQNKRLIAKEPQHIVVDLYLHKLITKKWLISYNGCQLLGREWVNDKTRELAVNSIFYLFKHYFKLKYEQRRQEVEKSTTEEATFANDSNSISINYNDIYLKVVGSKNEKGMYMDLEN